jgi:hypothetical protein
MYTATIPVRTAKGRRFVSATGRSAFHATLRLTQLLAARGLSGAADLSGRFVTVP